MRIGVVSDTHSNLPNTSRAVLQLAGLDVAAVLHCGDICSMQVIPLFAAWPTHFVFGNNDSQRDLLRQTIHEAGQFCHEDFGEVELDGRRIAMLHGDDSRRFRQATASGLYDLVCYGHSHIPEQHVVGKTLVLNPGALHRARPHSFAVVDLTTMSAKVIPLEGLL